MMRDVTIIDQRCYDELPTELQIDDFAFGKQAVNGSTAACDLSVGARKSVGRSFQRIVSGNP
jgi:hypothetical protein